MIFGFSDAIDEERLIYSNDGNSILILRPAALGQWSTETIDLTYYWGQTGWETPQDLYIGLFMSVHYTEPGTYNLYVAGIAEQSE